MLFDKKFYMVMLVIIVIASAIVGSQSDINFFISSLLTFFVLTFCSFLTMGAYVICNLYLANRSLRELIGW